ncbi:TonB family C-terminal domain-containing protein [Chitinophaga costaii]|uniref:TonB family C-terminal domain-containing protein n=1 Tax=Chitinophaga costaii TaxID=1335309 RepID=A0A1C4D724_9BACT|nr:TonB family protein [Chitinophaga costaii]PUZ24481.1 TonB family protein [Chitinophaga costaii]SCC27028.1 TonB family C-terminal domain-containing protein [Chitinophaga costaii]
MIYSLLLCLQLSVLAPTDTLLPHPLTQYDHPTPLLRSGTYSMYTEAEPFFPGGEDALRRYVGTNLKYPATTDSGFVNVKFHLNEKGKMQHPEIIFSSSPALNSEALRLVKTMPSWAPALQNEVPGGAVIILSVVFSHDQTMYFTPTGAPVQQVTVGHTMKPPAFPGGENALNNYLLSHIQYPEIARRKRMQGVVQVQFIVNQEGKVTNVKVAGEPQSYFDAEAIRVVANMPDWEPGTKNDVPTSVRFNLPVIFSLQ